MCTIISTNPIMLLSSLASGMMWHAPQNTKLSRMRYLSTYGLKLICFGCFSIHYYRHTLHYLHKPNNQTVHAISKNNMK